MSDWTSARTRADRGPAHVTITTGAIAEGEGMTR
jgi:hypothetical protein